MNQSDNLSYDTKEKINAITLNLLLTNKGYAKQEFSPSELKRLSNQMCNGICIRTEEIIGLYDGSIANSFSGNFGGILFLKDRIYVNLNKSTTSQCMRYQDIMSISGDPNAFFATLSLKDNGNNVITLKGIAYTTKKVFDVFANIISCVNDNQLDLNDQTENSPNAQHNNHMLNTSCVDVEERNIQKKSLDSVNNTKSEIYKKTTDLLLNSYKELCGDTSYIKGYEISDKKNQKIIKKYGSSFSREKILFCDKSLIFTPSLLVTADSIRCYSFSIDNGIINFKDIDRMCYNLMPTKTNIKINLGRWEFRKLYDGVPIAETYSDIKSYEKSVNSGRYKARTICYLATIYALTALYKASSNEYEKVYLEIEKNIKRLIEYQKDTNDISKRYGNFFSFDFVTCYYDFNEVEEALEKISSVKAEVRADEIQERKERFAQCLEKKLEETREQYERQQRK